MAYLKPVEGRKHEEGCTTDEPDTKPGAFHCGAERKCTANVGPHLVVKTPNKFVRVLRGVVRRNPEKKRSDARHLHSPFQICTRTDM